MRRLQSLDYVAYNEILSKKVPPSTLLGKISEINDNFAIQNNGLGLVLEKKN